MPTTTPIYGLVKPLGAEAANGPGAIGALADSVEVALSRPYVELTAAAATTIPTGAYTKVALATTSHLSGGSTYFTVASSVITIVQAGVYDLSAIGVFGAGISGGRYFAISKNGTSDHTIGEVGVAAATDWYATINQSDITIAAGATIQLVAYQTGQANLNTIHTGSNAARLSIRKVG
jgi:hypothetical protein